MPEGHTIHRLARDHRGWFVGETVAASSPQGRFADGAARLDGQRLLAVQALGKHLLYRFADTWLHVHLGLFGRSRSWKRPPEPRPSVRLRLASSKRTADLIGPTSCALWDAAEVATLTDRLGPDPLDEEDHVDDFVAALTRRRRAIGAVLLDQEAVAGLGNVYRAELLFRARLSPHRPARSVDDVTARALWADARELMRVGVRFNRIYGRTPDEVGRPWSRMRKADRYNVYKRRVCWRCDAAIRVEDLANRTVYWCPVCQA